jgi:hypothetical protein
VPSLPFGLMKTAVPSGRELAKDAADIAAVAHVLTAITDTDNVIGRGDVCAGKSAKGRISVASRVVNERFKTGGRIVGAHCVMERINAVSRILNARSVAIERGKPGRYIIVSGRVAYKRVESTGRILNAGGVVIERLTRLRYF